MIGATLAPWQRRDRALFRPSSDGRARVEVWPDRGGWWWRVTRPDGAVVVRGWAEGEQEAVRCADREALAAGWTFAEEGTAACPYASPDHLSAHRCPRCAEAAERTGTQG
jgi:hypothetical protein